MLRRGGRRAGRVGNSVTTGAREDRCGSWQIKDRKTGNFGRLFESLKLALVTIILRIMDEAGRGKGWDIIIIASDLS